MKANSMIIAAAVSVSLSALTVASAAEIAYKNGAWQWDDGSWEGGARPGPNDTALIPELPTLKTRYDAGTMQSNGLMQNEEIQTLRFSDLYGIKVQGTHTLTLNSIVCDDMSPSSEDTAQIATNIVATSYLALKGSEAEFRVGANHVLRLDANTLQKADEGVKLVKTGPGTVLHTGPTWNPTNTFWVKEGTYIRSGAGYPEFRSDIVVGGAGKDAVLTVLPSANQSLVVATSVIDVRAKGRLELPALGKYYYLETLKIDHGVIDGGGDTAFCMSNQGATECGTEYTLDGGTLSNGTIVVVYGGRLSICESDIPSRIFGSLSFNTGYDIEVPDGTAPVDFMIVGDLAGSNRGINKDGGGTMLVRCEDHISTWGGTAGRAFEIKGGRFFIESSADGIGMGTNNVVVASGAAYGGVGRHVGAPINLYGLCGNVTLNGAQDAPASLIPGMIDESTGAIAPGTFTIGSADQTNNVTFVNSCKLQIAADRESVSKLVVNGLLTLSGSDELAIVGPEDPKKLPQGEHVIVSTKEPLADVFTSVTYNGVALVDSVGKVKYESNAVIFRVSTRGLTITVR